MGRRLNTTPILFILEFYNFIQVDSNKKTKLLIMIFYKEYFLVFDDSSKFIFFYTSQMGTKIKLSSI